MPFSGCPENRVRRQLHATALPCSPRGKSCAVERVVRSDQYYCAFRGRVQFWTDGDGGEVAVPCHPWEGSTCCRDMAQSIKGCHARARALAVAKVFWSSK